MEKEVLPCVRARRQAQLLRPECDGFLVLGRGINPAFDLAPVARIVPVFAAELSQVFLLRASQCLDEFCETHTDVLLFCGKHYTTHWMSSTTEGRTTGPGSEIRTLFRGCGRAWRLFCVFFQNTACFDHTSVV